jgi:hypothetical protein
VDNILIDERSFEGWVRGIETGDVWGDETVIIAVSLMWNIPISVITINGIMPVFHDEAEPTILLLGNGPFHKIDHFSGTGKLVFLYGRSTFL